MQYLKVVEGLQSSDNLNHNLPDVFLLDLDIFIFTITDPLENISIICKLHHNAVWGTKIDDHIN